MMVSYLLIGTVATVHGSGYAQRPPRHTNSAPSPTSYMVSPTAIMGHKGSHGHAANEYNKEWNDIEFGNLGKSKYELYIEANQDYIREKQKTLSNDPYTQSIVVAHAFKPIIRTEIMNFIDLLNDQVAEQLGHKHGYKRMMKDLSDIMNNKEGTHPDFARAKHQQAQFAAMRAETRISLSALLPEVFKYIKDTMYNQDGLLHYIGKTLGKVEKARELQKHYEKGVEEGLTFVGSGSFAVIIAQKVAPQMSPDGRVAWKLELMREGIYQITNTCVLPDYQRDATGPIDYDPFSNEGKSLSTQKTMPMGIDRASTRRSTSSTTDNDSNDSRTPPTLEGTWRQLQDNGTLESAAAISQMQRALSLRNKVTRSVHRGLRHNKSTTLSSGETTQESGSGPRKFNFYESHAENANDLIMITHDRAMDDKDTPIAHLYYRDDEMWSVDGDIVDYIVDILWKLIPKWIEQTTSNVNKELLRQRYFTNDINPLLATALAKSSFPLTFDGDDGNGSGNNLLVGEILQTAMQYVPKSMNLDDYLLSLIDQNDVFPTDGDSNDSLLYANGVTGWDIVRKVRKVLSKFLKAVDAMHTRYNIMHRDLKAPNVMIYMGDDHVPDEDVSVKLIDMDFSCSISQCMKTVWALLPTGTESHMAHELMGIGAGKVAEEERYKWPFNAVYDEKVDYFSAGTIAYSLFYWQETLMAEHPIFGYLQCNVNFHSSGTIDYVMMLRNSPSPYMDALKKNLNRPQLSLFKVVDINKKSRDLYGNSVALVDSDGSEWYVIMEGLDTVVNYPVIDRATIERVSEADRMTFPNEKERVKFLKWFLTAAIFELLSQREYQEYLKTAFLTPLNFKWMYVVRARSVHALVNRNSERPLRKLTGGGSFVGVGTYLNQLSLLAQQSRQYLIKLHWVMFNKIIKPKEGEREYRPECFPVEEDEENFGRGMRTSQPSRRLSCGRAEKLLEKFYAAEVEPLSEYEAHLKQAKWVPDVVRSESPLLSRSPNMRGRHFTN